MLCELCRGKFEWIKLTVFVVCVVCSWAGLGAGSWLTFCKSNKKGLVGLSVESGLSLLTLLD